MRNIKLILQYDGTDFCGWQGQSQGERTVQDTLEAAIARLTGACAPVVGSGRTDSGVHALAQVAAFQTDSGHSVQVLRRALNAMLPPDLRVIKALDMAPEFHPIKSARSKHYMYIISNTPVLSPFARRYAWHLRGGLDIAAMRDAASHMIGERDFRCFMASGSGAKTTVRELTSLEVDATNSIQFMGMKLDAERGGQYIRVDARGGGFLRHMVRNIAGTLVEVGKGAMRPSDMHKLLESGDRGLAGPTAPAQGLFMVAVEYAQEDDK